jgi:hypothetical protein
VKDAFTPEVKDKDIAKAELKHQELRQKEEMDRRRAEGTSAQQAQLQSHAEHLQVYKNYLNFEVKHISTPVLKKQILPLKTDPDH